MKRKPKRGRCSHCGYRFLLNAKGELRLHSLFMSDGSKWECPGSYMLPQKETP